MEKTWRWFGKNDRITLDRLRQIGVEGIVTSLHDIPNGEVWSEAAIGEMKQYIEDGGLRWSVVESLPVSESIKYGGPDREQLLANYRTSLANLGKAGIRTVVYNFMPVLDWIRTDVEYPLENGTKTLYFDRVRFAYFDVYILDREGARSDYTPEELQQADELRETITEAEKQDLIETIIIKTQGFVSGNFHEGDANPVGEFKKMLALYKGIDRAKLRENLKYFLENVLPTAEEYGIRLCVHPDDPPRQVLGLPRVVTSGEDLQWILDAAPSPSNCLAFCAGSLSAGAHNDIPSLAARFVKQIGFAHLRSTTVLPNGNFMEALHTCGRANLVEVIRTFEKYDPSIPMRIDHGQLFRDDEGKGDNAGYSFLGRMHALAVVTGMMAVVDDEIKRGLV